MSLILLFIAGLLTSEGVRMGFVGLQSGHGPDFFRGVAALAVAGLIAYIGAVS